MSDATNTEGQTAAPAAAPADAPAAAPAATPAPPAAPAPAPASGESQPASAPASDDPSKQGTESKSAEPVFEYRMPEGLALDQTAADSLTAFAKEHGLKPEDAQKVADIGAQMVQRQAEAHAQQVATWVEQVKADPEIGGADFDKNLGVAKEAMAKFGTPELKDVLLSSGLGNHPAVVKFFFQVGKLVSQDRPEIGREKTDVAPAARMYSASNMNP